MLPQDYFYTVSHELPVVAHQALNGAKDDQNPRSQAFPVRRCILRSRVEFNEVCVLLSDK